MYLGVIVAVHLSVVIAILIKLFHVILHQISSTVRIVGTIDESLLGIGIFPVNSQFSGIHPIGIRYAKNAAGALFRAGANGRGIAATNGLTNTIQTQLRYGFIQDVTY